MNIAIEFVPPLRLYGNGLGEHSVISFLTLHIPQGRSLFHAFGVSLHSGCAAFTQSNALKQDTRIEILDAELLRKQLQILYPGHLFI